MTPKAAAPVVVWLFGVVWLFWLRVGLLYLFLLLGAVPEGELSRTMDRNFYYIGIAFFGMINGLFNQIWLLFALIHVQILAPALLFGSVSLTLMFASLMVSTATIILGGIPAAIYERVIGAKDDSTEVSLWIWLAGTALLTLPAIGNFFSNRALNLPASARNAAPQTPACDGVAGGFAARSQRRTRFPPRGRHGTHASRSPSRRCCAPAASARSPSSA